MSDIVSMSSGPQGSASSSEAFSSDAPSHEFGHEEQSDASSTEQSDGAENNVPRGTDGNGDGNGDGRPQSAGQKQESRYERTKRERKEFHAQRESFKQEQAQTQAQFAQLRAQLAQERQQLEQSKKPKRNYSLTDLKGYREAWKQEAEQGIEGKAELVRRADAEIAAMEAEESASKQVVELPKRGTPEHRQMWEQGEADLRARDPEFMKPGSRVDKKLRELFAGPDAQAYVDHPQGIYAAYSEARRQILEEDVKGLQTENAKLKKELQRYNGLTSIGGGVPGRVGEGGITSTADFARLSSADMKKHLMAKARAAKDSDGWL